MFPGFTIEYVDAGDVQLRVCHGGTGPPVLLLHGHPRTLATWHQVAPLLARRFRVVCCDLRGYGQSSKPAEETDHSTYSKRAMAADGIAIMDHLGHHRFAIVGHDRGAYVAYRAALDFPQQVERVAVLDGVPIVEALERCDERFAREWWHWFFFAEPDKPERAIVADPDAWYGATPALRRRMGELAWADWQCAIHNPATVHAMLEDYRAGLAIDRHHDAQDRAEGRRIRCPLLMLWAQHDDMERLYGDPLQIWRAWADDVRGRGLPCGHHMAEEMPEVLAATLDRFLADAELA
jgi:haloacetate dehalogenase